MGSRRFDYVQYDETAAEKQAQLKGLFLQVESEVERLLPGGRYKALTLTALEESYSWAGKALKDECIERHPDVADEPHRTDG